MESGDDQTMADYFIKILVLGNTAVGKSSLVSSYTKLEFPKEITGSLYPETSQKDIMLQDETGQNKQLKIQIQDTAGQTYAKNVTQITRTYFRDVTGVAIIYDVTDQRSYEDIKNYWLHQVVDNCEEPVELFLVANKTDLRNDRVITKEQA